MSTADNEKPKTELQQESKKPQPSESKKSPKPEPPKLESAPAFLKKQLPKKEPIIDRLLYKRDLVTLAGRRRHGKTSLMLNLALSVVDPYYSDLFVGYQIVQPGRVLLYLLEDDATELQDRLRSMCGNREYELDGLAIRTKDDFYPLGIKVDVSDKTFRDHVLRDVEQHKPDVVMFDNLAHLLGGDYNDSTKMHEFAKFQFEIAAKGNCAVITAAHPRKQTQDSRYKPSLAKHRDDFFDEVMGSSHFVNTTGSLWGIEKTPEGFSYFLGGTQRLTGTSSVCMIEMDDEGWFQVLNDAEANYKLVVHTPKRKEAWALLSEDRPFTYTQAEELCKDVLSSKSGFTSFWNDIKRVQLIVAEDQGFVAVKVPGVAKKVPDKPPSERKTTT